MQGDDPPRPERIIWYERALLLPLNIFFLVTRPRATRARLAEDFAVEKEHIRYLDPQRLNDERRYDVPATVIACEFPSSMLIEMIAGGHPYVAELGRVRDVEYVDLPTGHWPQFTKPAELGAAILAAVGRGA